MQKALRSSSRAFSTFTYIQLGKNNQGVQHREAVQACDSMECSYPYYAVSPIVRMWSLASNLRTV